MNMEEAEAAVMDYEGMVAKGSMLGSAGCIVIDDAQCMVKQIARLARFYAHESCAQCTQCREGTAWTTKIMERIEAGAGTDGRLRHAARDRREHDRARPSACSATRAPVPVVSGIQKWRHEFEAHITGKRCPFRAAAAA
jgi:NADH-quinone oxidoreductase subunit F